MYEFWGDKIQSIPGGMGFKHFASRKKESPRLQGVAEGIEIIGTVLYPSQTFLRQDLEASRLGQFSTFLRDICCERLENMKIKFINT